MITFNQFEIIECPEETYFIGKVIELLHHILILLRVLPIFESLSLSLLQIEVCSTNGSIVSAPYIVHQSVCRPSAIYKIMNGRRLIYMHGIVRSSILHGICRIAKVVGQIAVNVGHHLFGTFEARKDVFLLIVVRLIAVHKVASAQYADRQKQCYMF